MVQISDTFWTDGTQATERLQDTVINYDGKAVLVVGCGEESISIRNTVNKKVLVPMSDPKWNKFRDVPRSGWYNAEIRGFPYTGAVYVRRASVRTRSHGLSRNNSTVYFFDPQRGLYQSRDYNIKSIIHNEVFYESQAGEYPQFEAAYNVLREGSGLALCPLYCLSRDMNDGRALWRKRKKVGIVLTPDTIHLHRKYSYLREEILDTRNLPNNVVEI